MINKWIKCRNTAVGIGAAVMLLSAAIPTIAQLNENCTVSVLNRNVQAGPDGTWVLTNIPVGQGLVRARATCVLNGQTRFGQSDLFTVPLNGSVTLQPITFGVVTPIPDSLALTAPTTNLGQVGATTQLTITARYSNGSSLDVTSSSAGTTYTSSNPAIATVSANGLVTAVTGGFALISAFNEGTVGTVSIRVGIPPTITITSPTPNTTVVEGSTLHVTATVTGTAAFVRFLVDGQVRFTTNTAPYQFDYVIPLGVTGIVLGAQADDGLGLIGIAPNVPINVIPDPLTTVTGRVVDSGGTPLGGASVSTVGNHQSITASDGSFLIQGVPTARGNIIVSAQFTPASGPILNGSSAAVPPVLGGITNVGTITVLPVHFEPNFGTRVAVCDDCVVQRTLPFPFPFFGTNRTTAFVSMNGNIGFTFADGSFTENIPGFPNQPRIAAFWDDLIAGAGITFPESGLYINDQLPGEFVVTYLREQQFCCTGDNTIQIILFSDGRIEFAYHGVTTRHALVGVTAGPGSPLQQVNFRTAPTFSFTGAATVLELYTDPANPFDLDNGFILWTPNAGTGYNVTTILQPSTSTATPAVSTTAAIASTQPPLSGLVRNSQGVVIKNAEIEVTSSADPSYRGLTNTNTQGNFAIAGVPFGGITLTIRQNGQIIGQWARVLQPEDLHTLYPNGLDVTLNPPSGTKPQPRP
jgi:hypothetical protein